MPWKVGCEGTLNSAKNPKNEKPNLLHFLFLEQFYYQWILNKAKHSAYNLGGKSKTKKSKG